MADHVIDCCSLINLYTGWHGLEELSSLGDSWHVCEAVISETEYTREYAIEGIVTIPINLHGLVAKGVLTTAKLETEKEFDDYVNLAMEVDDGEAQAIAIANSRGYTLLTDDHKAMKIASDLGLTIVSSAALLEKWGELDSTNRARLAEVVRRISTLARFNPRRDSPHYEWWQGLLGS